MPAIRHLRADQEIVVMANTGEVWQGAGAWVMCLWATRSYRGLAERLASPHLLPLACGAAFSAAGLRHLLADRGARGGDYPDACAGSCPIPEG